MSAPELAPIVHAIFTQSLDTGELPRGWSLANVAPIFKKSNRVLAENYRPVSLTCITCKLLEHIVCRHILDHVEDHKILTNLQHGFRSGRSCETQLITTTHDLLSSFNSKSQIDVAILDFSKAFDTVPHAVGLSRLIDLNRIKSIQVANRLIDSKLLNRFTETIHYFYLLMALLPENANKLIFI